MKESRVYLIYIRDCINRIKQYTLDRKEVFFNDIKTQDAVLRNVQVMCESIQKLLSEWKMVVAHKDRLCRFGFEFFEQCM